jgi:uncharacterized membrane protein (UPF0127 family)
LKLSGGLIAAVVLFSLGGVLLVYAAVQALGDGDPAPANAEGTTLGAALRKAEPADDPFAGWTAAEITVGNREMDVVIADEVDERGQGMRGRADLGPYGGMIFVYGADTQPAFTMSGVPVPLDIGFYSATGDELDRLEMVPCEAIDSECPAYLADAPFRFAIETLTGELPEGTLSG